MFLWVKFNVSYKCQCRECSANNRISMILIIFSTSLLEEILEFCQNALQLFLSMIP